MNTTDNWRVGDERAWQRYGAASAHINTLLFSFANLIDRCNPTSDSGVSM
jgi:hypothetical protein